MEVLTLEEFIERADAYNASALSMRGISNYCSSMDWLLAAHYNVHDTTATLILHEDGHWAVFSLQDTDEYALLHAFEWGWGFACPLIGEDMEILARLLTGVMDYFPSVQCIVLSGLPSRLYHYLR